MYTTQSLFASTIYYSSDHTELSVEEYTEAAIKYKKKFLEAKKSWGSIKSDSLRQCIDLSGMNEPFDRFVQEIDALSNQGVLTTGHSEVDNKVLDIIKDSFDPGSANKKLIAYSKKRMNKQIVAEVLAWFKTPLGRKITDAENVTSSAEAQKDMVRYISNLQNNPPSQDRVLVLEKFVEASGVVEISADMGIKLLKGMNVSINLALPEERRIDKERIETIIEKAKPALVQQLRHQLTLGSYFIYRNISNEDLEGYIAFLKSDSGSKFFKIGTDAVISIFVEHFADIGGEIASTLPPIVKAAEMKSEVAETGSVLSVARVAESGSESSHADGDFTFTEPPGWRIAEMPGLKYKVAFGEPIDGFAPNINVVDEYYSQGLESYVEGNEKNMSKLFQNFKQIQKSSFQTNSGLNGIKLITEADPQGMSLRQTFYFFSGYGDKKIVVTCSVPKAHGGKYDSIFDASLKTFSFGK